ncbi:MAG: M56 family metallopeptidase [Negativibacillus sp.]|nr:M56 family metallopeptidase [Negativibacillus sp.]
MSFLQMSLAASVMILVILLIRTLAIHRLPKRFFLLLWVVVLLRLLVPFSLPSPTSIYSLLPTEPLPAPDIEQALSVPSAPPAASPWEAFELNLPSDLPAQTVQTAQTAEPTLEPAQEEETDPMPAFSLPSKKQLMTAGWAVGAVLLALFFSISYLRAQTEFRMSLPVTHPFLEQWLARHPLRRTISIRQDDRISSPLTYGILHPVILLPRQNLSLPQETLDCILTHEYVHIRRFDCLLKLLLTAALCLHWLNPLVWVMYLLANRDIELCCDEEVLSRMGLEKRSVYAMTLIDLEEQKSGLSPLYNSFKHNLTEERICAIMKMKRLSIISLFTAACLLVGVTTVFATSPSSKTGKETAAQQAVADPAVYDVYEPFHLTVKDDQKLYYFDLLVGKLEDSYLDNADTKSVNYLNENGVVDLVAFHDGKHVTCLSVTANRSATSVPLYITRDLVDFVMPDQCASMEEYFEQFTYLTFVPAKADPSSGNLYCDDQLVSTFTHEENGKKFVFTSQNGSTSLSPASPAPSFDLTCSRGAVWESRLGSRSPILPGNASVLFQLTGEGLFPDRENGRWTYQDKVVRRIIDGNFPQQVSADGEIDLQVSYQNGGPSVKEITAEEFDKLANQLLAPKEFVPPVRSPKSVTQSDSALYAANVGDEVLCSVGGKVTHVGWQEGLGKCVRITDSKATTWTYAHLDSIDVQAGHTIQAGTRIGTVGQTGNAAEPCVELLAHLEQSPLNVSKLLG